MPAYIQVSGDTVLLDAVPVSAFVTGSATVTAGATTLSKGDTDSRYYHVEPVLLLAGRPVQAEVLGEALRRNDEVLSIMPFEFEVPITSRTGPQSTNLTPVKLLQLFIPDSARRLEFDFEARLWGPTETGRVKVTVGSHLPNTDIDVSTDILDYLNNPSVEEAEFALEGDQWQTCQVRMDISQLAKTLDMVKGVHSGSTEVPATGYRYPNCISLIGWTGFLLLTGLAFSVQNYNSGQVSVRRSRDWLARYGIHERRDGENNIEQGYLENISPSTNLRALQDPDRGYTQIDMDAQNIVAGRPVSPVVLAALAQNDRSQASVQRIPSFSITAPDANWVVSNNYRCYVPKWAGELGVFFQLDDVGPFNTVGLQRASVRLKITNAADSGDYIYSETKIFSNAYDDISVGVFGWSNSEVTGWIFADVRDRFAGVTVKLQYEIANLSGSIAKTLRVSSGDYQSSYVLYPHSLFFIPPQAA